MRGAFQGFASKPPLPLGRFRPTPSRNHGQANGNLYGFISKPPPPPGGGDALLPGPDQKLRMVETRVVSLPTPLSHYTMGEGTGQCETPARSNGKGGLAKKHHPLMAKPFKFARFQLEDHRGLGYDASLPPRGRGASANLPHWPVLHDIFLFGGRVRWSTGDLRLLVF